MALFNDENRPLVAGNDNQDNSDISNKREIEVYRRRWWILAEFCLLCTCQAMVWNTWGPIAASVEAAMGWSDGVIALFNNFGSILYCIVIIPASVLIDAKGMRFSMIASCGIYVIATALRCFSLNPDVLRYTSYICAIITGLGATVPFGGPPRIAALWFPHTERPVATAISSFFNYFGMSLSFIIGPQYVPDPVYGCKQSLTGNGFDVNVTYQCLENATLLNRKEIETGISSLLYTHSGLSVLVFVFVLVYFPAKPPKPPSFTASLQRTDYRRAIKKVFQNGPLWMILISGGLTLGFCGAWIAIIDVVLKPLGVSQIDAGWMGFWHVLVGCLSGILFARYSDIFHRKRKYFLLTIYGCASAACLWFTLLGNGLITLDLTSMYAAIILFGMFINGSVPLFYELCAEIAYPVSEGVAGGIFTFVLGLFEMIFLFSVSVADGDTTWMNWTILGSVLVPIPLILLFQEKHKRTDLDVYLDS